MLISIYKKIYKPLKNSFRVRLYCNIKDFEPKKDPRNPNNILIMLNSLILTKMPTKREDKKKQFL